MGQLVYRYVEVHHEHRSMLEGSTRRMNGRDPWNFLKVGGVQECVWNYKNIMLSDTSCTAVQVEFS
jgi:hypothetical protein